MEISFDVAGNHYHGTAVPFERPGNTDTQFVIRLEDDDLPPFHMHLSPGGEWVSEDLAVQEILAAAGAAIIANSDTEIRVNGEIVNEPDDAEEKGVAN